MVASSSFSFSFVLLLVACTTVTASTGFYEENALYSGERLRINEALRWGKNNFIMQFDCNVGFYDGTVHRWFSNTFRGGADCSTFLHHNGNLVIYDDVGKQLWQSNTAGTPGDYVLLLQEDENAVLYGKSIWSTRKPLPPAATAAATDHLATATDHHAAAVLPVGPILGAQPVSDGRYIQNVLYEGEFLLTNQELRTKSHRLIMQGDCNLVLYNANYDAVWSSNTSNRDTQCYAGLARSGSLVIYGELGDVLWHSRSSRGEGDYMLILRNDGVVMIYSKVLWSVFTFKPRGLTTNSTSTSNISMVTSSE